MNGNEVAGPLVAFLGGLLSFLSPCVLPLVPSYVGFLTGLTIDEVGDRRRWALFHAICFVVGFSLIFIAMGAGATELGAMLNYNKSWLSRAGGVLVIGFGLYSLGMVRVSALDQDRRLHLNRKPLGFLGSVLVGMVFAAGWTPCIGPVLGSILVLAGNSNDLRHGVLLLTAYSAGLALPFLAVAVGLDAFREWFQRFRPWLPWVQRISGVLLILIGLLLVTGEFTRLAALLSAATPGFLRKQL